MEIQEFEKMLPSIVGRPTTLRPFICDGSPLICEIFLVGINPATGMKSDFWEFWTPGHGYDKAKWFERYLAERAAKPLAPGRKQKQKVSATRRLMNQFVEGAGPVRVLETNIDARPTADAKHLNLQNVETTTFEFLLHTIKPKVVVVHGQLAGEVIRKIAPSAHLIFAERHFSRGTSNLMACDCGRLAAKECLKGN